MPSRIAAAMALIAFATCLVMGMVAENPFSTVILRALGALVVTLVVGLVLGAMAQKMLEENVNPGKKNMEIGESKPVSKDR